MWQSESGRLRSEGIPATVMAMALAIAVLTLLSVSGVGGRDGTTQLQGGVEATATRWLNRARARVVLGWEEVRGWGAAL